MFTRKNQQIGHAYTNMLQMYRFGKNTNDNLNTHDFEYIEVGANTLKSSSTFQFPTKIMFS